MRHVSRLSALALIGFSGSVVVFADDYQWIGTSPPQWSGASYAGWSPLNGAQAADANHPGAADNIVQSSTPASSLQLGSAPRAINNIIINEGGALTISATSATAANSTLPIGGSITKDGTGVLTLTSTGGAAGTGAYDVAGSVDLHGGVTTVGGAGTTGTPLSLTRFSVGGTTTIDVGATLVLGANQNVALHGLVVNGSLALLNTATSDLAETVNVTSLAGSGTISAGTAAGTNLQPTLAVTNDGDSTFSGIITDGTSAIAALTKAGTGNLTLAGVNTYTGVTTVSGGTLTVNGSIAGSSLTSVGQGATLAGTGTVGALSLAAGSVTTPGGTGAIGTLTVDGGAAGAAMFTAASGSTFNFDFGAGNTGDSVSFWNYVGSSDVVINGITLNASNLQVGSYTLFSFYSDAGTTPVDFALSPEILLGSGFDDPNLVAQIVTQGNLILLNVTTEAVPEPATWALAGLGAMALAWRRRRG